MSDEIKWMVFSKMIVRCKTSLQYAVLEVNIWEARGMQSANYAPSWSNETWRPTRRGQPRTCVNTTQLFPSYHQFRTSGSAAMCSINKYKCYELQCEMLRCGWLLCDCRLQSSIRQSPAVTCSASTSTLSLPRPHLPLTSAWGHTGDIPLLTVTEVTPIFTLFLMIWWHNLHHFDLMTYNDTIHNDIHLNFYVDVMYVWC